MSNTMDNSTDGFATTVTILVPIHICIGIATVFGNALVIILTLRNKELKKTTNILIGSLACIDAFVGLFGTPVIILNMYYVLYVGDGWLACVICPILFVAPMLSDLGVMLLILSERYRAIVQFHKPPYTTKQVVYMLMGVFVMSLALCGNYVLSFVTGSSCVDMSQLLLTTHCSLSVFGHCLGSRLSVIQELKRIFKVKLLWVAIEVDSPNRL